MSRSFSSTSAQATRTFAANWADRLLNTHKSKRAVILGLVGDLGSGKTTFTQGFIKGCGISRKVLSPTFVILKRFHLPRSRAFRDIYHIDAYRIHRRDLADLRWEDVLAGHNIVVVEWADKIRPALPQRTIWVHFKHGRTENERHITIN